MVQGIDHPDNNNLPTGRVREAANALDARPHPSGDSFSGSRQMDPCIQLRRTADTTDLLYKNHEAFVLLTLIAYRAARTRENLEGLEPNQARIGDWKLCGFRSERCYRTAKKRLSKCGLVTFKATNMGTIATLMNIRIYNINAEQNGEQSDEQVTSEVTGKRRASDEQVTTNKNGKNGKNGKNEKNTPSSEALRLSDLLLSLIRARKPDFVKHGDWAKDLDRMIRLDHRTPEGIEAVLRWSQADPFWQANILSGAKLREKFDQLDLKMKGQNDGTRPTANRQNPRNRDFDNQTSDIGCVIET